MTKNLAKMLILVLRLVKRLLKIDSAKPKPVGNRNVLDMSSTIELCNMIIDKFKAEEGSNMANTKNEKKEDNEMQVANEFYDARKEYPKEMTTASESNKGK